MNSKQVINNPYQPPARPVLLTGCDGRPKLAMTAADGAHAVLYLQGARLTSWTPAGGSEWLFLSERTRFDGDEPVRGGIALLFPQPDSEDFASMSDWSLVRVSQTDAAVTALLKLTDTRATRRSWRQRFRLGLLVTVRGNRLSLQWHIKNTGQKPLQFSTTVQQYLRLADGIGAARLLGLQGQGHHDVCDDTCTRPAASAAGAECPRHYPSFGAPLLLRDGGRTLNISSHSLPALTVHNTKPAPGEAGQFLRLDVGSGELPQELQPGELWRAELAFSADQAPLLITKE